MHNPHLAIHADRPLHLEACNFGSPCLRVLEAPLYEVCAPLCVTSIHNAAPDTGEGMDRLLRAVEAFNAVMGGATLLPVTMPAAADVMTGHDPLRTAHRAAVADIATALDGVASREMEPHL